jgi:SAM-dependent methyltransferase
LLVTFQDHFSEAPSAYAAFRPHYPAALFEFLAACVPRRLRAWDCATGNGQAALGLAGLFDQVIATDASAAQVAQARPCPNIEYRVAPAEDSGIAAGSIDLVTVAQALHWLDREAFFTEARRVLVPRGVIAVWCYSWVTIDPLIDETVRAFNTQEVGPYWPPGRELVDEGYRSIGFPFEELAVPPFAIEQDMTLAEFAGYVRTWSATQRYTAAQKVDPVIGLADRLARRWGPPGAIRRVRWPLHVRAGRVTPARRRPPSRSQA